MSYEGKNLETIALHTGWRNDENTGSVAVPILFIKPLVINSMILPTQQAYLDCRSLEISTQE